VLYLCAIKFGGCVTRYNLFLTAFFAMPAMTLQINLRQSRSVIGLSSSFLIFNSAAMAMTVESRRGTG
jgi:hypothetical protein